MAAASIKLRHLEMLLSQLMPHPRPKLRLEEYTIDPQSAARLLYIAEYVNRDVRNKRVVDLGCGTGRLAIGATLLGAEQVVGVDIDKENIVVALENTAKAKVEVEYVIGDIESIHGRFDTTLMNPPFGSWNKGADIPFLRKAMEISRIVYSLHKRTESNRRFLSQKIVSFGGKVDTINELEMMIPHTFKFHHKQRQYINVDLYRISM